jgi:hypothetical protein
MRELGKWFFGATDPEPVAFLHVVVHSPSSRRAKILRAQARR